MSTTNRRKFIGRGVTAAAAVTAASIPFGNLIFIAGANVSGDIACV